MFYLAICRDKPGHTQLRADTREVHVAWLKTLGGALKIAGPFLDDTGAEMRGSMLVVEAETLDAAKAMLSADPYRSVGLFETVEVKPWRWTIGAPA